MNTRRDCQCPRARHQHGTVRAYNADACRCRPCTDAAVTKQRSYRKRRHLAKSAHTGLTLPPQGTQRRLRALAALGWTSADLGAKLGVTAENVQNMQRRTKKCVYLGTATRVAELYDELSMRRPDPFRWQHARRANSAKALGWQPPLFYDDDTIDSVCLHTPIYNVSTSKAAGFIDEIAVERAMHGERIKLTKAEMSDAITKLTDMGLSADMTAARLGVSDRLVQRYRAKGRAA